MYRWSELQGYHFTGGIEKNLIECHILFQMHILPGTFLLKVSPCQHLAALAISQLQHAGRSACSRWLVTMEVIWVPSSMDQNTAEAIMETKTYH